MPRHTVTKEEMERVVVEEMIASAFGKGQTKRLVFSYDIGKKRLRYVVEDRSTGQTREETFDTLDVAIAVYNDL